MQYRIGHQMCIRDSIWLKPDVMAQYKLIPSDVTAALAEQNIESATGSLGENSENTFQYLSLIHISNEYRTQN